MSEDDGGAISNVLMNAKGIASEWVPPIEWIEHSWRTYKRSLYFHRDNWLIFLRSWCLDKSEFIREFAHPQRRVTRNIEQLHSQLLYFGYQKRNSCYITIYEFAQVKEPSNSRRASGQSEVPVYDSAIVNEIAFDFDQAECCHRCYTKLKMRKKFKDCPKCGWSTENAEPKEFVLIQSLYDVWREVKRAWARFDNCKVVFTGGRGFQLRAKFEIDGHAQDIEQTIQFLTATQRKAYDELKTLSMDDGHFGDVARVYRIPYTLHANKLRFCVPVMPNENLDDIHKRSLSLLIPSPIEYVSYKEVMECQKKNPTETTLQKSD